jgi:hypothetical protein
VDKIYEIVGFTDDSQSWLYWVITPELPEGLKVGENLDDDVRFYGFFFKIQRYVPVGEDALRPKYQIAPLMIGRIVPEQPMIPVAGESPPWAWWLIGAGVIALALTIFGWMMASNRRKGLPGGVTAPGDRPFEEWLANPVLGGDDRGASDGGPGEAGQESGVAGMYFGALGNNSGDSTRNSSSEGDRRGSG